MLVFGVGMPSGHGDTCQTGLLIFLWGVFLKWLSHWRMLEVPRIEKNIRKQRRLIWPNLSCSVSNESVWVLWITLTGTSLNLETNRCYDMFTLTKKKKKSFIQRLKCSFLIKIIWETKVSCNRIFLSTMGPRGVFSVRSIDHTSSVANILLAVVWIVTVILEPSMTFWQPPEMMDERAGCVS